MFIIQTTSQFRSQNISSGLFWRHRVGLYTNDITQAWLYTAAEVEALNIPPGHSFPVNMAPLLLSMQRFLRHHAGLEEPADLPTIRASSWGVGYE